MEIVAEMEGLQKSQVPSRKGAYTDLLGLTLSSSATVAAQKAPGTYGEELNCLASGREPKGQTPPRKKCWQRPLFLF